MSDYDDVHVVPKEASYVDSRYDVELKTNIPGIGSVYPVFSSPMKNISSPELVIGMWECGCLGILHRFDTRENRIEAIDKVHGSQAKFGIAIGLNDFAEELKIAKYAVSKGAQLICVDVANGYIAPLRAAGNTLRTLFPQEVSLMAGNVVDYEGCESLRRSGFGFVRVGIGTGGLCSTRTVTGVSRHQLKALDDCASTGAHIVSDGGIDTPGKAVKSFVAGASFVMIGSLLAHSNEAGNDGLIYGMASRINHEKAGKTIKSVEGIEKRISTNKLPLAQIIDELLWGIRSACTYLNCSNVSELRDCQFEKASY